MSRRAAEKVVASSGLNVAGRPFTSLPWRRCVSHCEDRPKYRRATSLKLINPHISRADSHTASALLSIFRSWAFCRFLGVSFMSLYICSSPARCGAGLLLVF